MRSREDAQRPRFFMKAGYQLTGDDKDITLVCC